METVVLWWADGSMVFHHVACGADPPRIQPVIRVAPASGPKGSACSRVDVAFLGSSRFARLCAFGAPRDGGGSGGAAAGGGAGEACAAGPGPQLSIYRLPYLFPNMAGRAGGSGSTGSGTGSAGWDGFPISIEPLAQAASLNSWGATEATAGAGGCGGSGAGDAGGGEEACVTVAALAGSNSHAAEFVAQVGLVGAPRGVGCMPRG